MTKHKPKPVITNITATSNSGERNADFLEAFTEAVTAAVSNPDTLTIRSTLIASFREAADEIPATFEAVREAIEATGIDDVSLELT